MKPNWKNPADYNTPPDANLDFWAGQFLWRNRQFIEDIQSVIFGLEAVVTGLKNSTNKETVQPRKLACMCTIAGERIMRAFFRKWGVDSMAGVKLIEGLLLDSGIEFEVYPRLIPGYVVDTTGGIFPESATGKSFCVTPEYPENLVLEFDLTAPINPQIERAKKMLVAQQKRNNRGKLIVKKAIVSLYPWYLRTLDALAAGAKHSEMIEIFSAQYQDAISDDTMRNWQREAERLRDGGYLDLVTAPAASPGK